MAKKRNPHSSDAEESQSGSSLERLSRAVRTHPVTTLAIGAGVGALMGAELLAAGLVGGAAILLLQRGDLRERARRFVDEARERIDDMSQHSAV